MNDTVEKKGRCLCGKVEVNAKTVDPGVHACHCNMCQAWNGGPTLSMHCGTEVSFSGESEISVYPSCDWAELGFCRNCGSHLILPAGGERRIHPAGGNLRIAAGAGIEAANFHRGKPAFYDFANQTGARVFASFAADSD